MKRKAGEAVPKSRQTAYRLFLLLFAALLFAGLTAAGRNPEAGVSTAEEIRVGLKSRFAGKQSIPLYNKGLELGYCDGREYRRETVLSSENGVKVTVEGGAFLAAEGRFSLPQAEQLAEQLGEAGAAAYAVTEAAGTAGIYLPIEENGRSEGAAVGLCEAAAKKCGLSLKGPVRKSDYLIRIDAGERILLADGAGGAYPQFAATEKNDAGIFAVNLGSRSYRGRIEIGRYGGKMTLTAVNVVPLEEYLYGVVPCEMPASWHMEALKAQAVCARSYALIKAGYHAETEIKRGFRMVDTIQSQVYGGTAYEHVRSSAAVDATRGKTLCYENRTVTGYYFSASGGHTENVEDVWGFSLPYLQGVPDLYEGNLKAPWSVSLSRENLERVLLSEGEDVGTVRRVMPEVTTASGRVYRLRVIGSRGSAVLTTDALRNVLGLPSTKFRIIGPGILPDQVTVLGAAASREAALQNCHVISGDGRVQRADALTGQYVVLGADNLMNFPGEAPVEGEYLFVGMGHGHGVGMSQSGACGMAERGFSYTEILEHYFTGISVR